MNDLFDVREKILKMSMGLFARFGFKKTSMDEIAHAAHIGKATIYQYFRRPRCCSTGARISMLPTATATLRCTRR